MEGINSDCLCRDVDSRFTFSFPDYASATDNLFRHDVLDNFLHDVIVSYFFTSCGGHGRPIWPKPTFCRRLHMVMYVRIKNYFFLILNFRSPSCHISFIKKKSRRGALLKVMISIMSQKVFCVFRKDSILSTFDIGQYCYAIDFTDCLLKRQTGNFPVS